MSQPGSGAPLMSAIRLTWLVFVIGMMPGRIGLSTPSADSSSTHPGVLLDLEEELRHREVGDAQLVGEVPSIGFAVGRTRVHLRVGGDRGGETAGRHDVFEQLDRVAVVAGLRLAVGARVAGQGEDVLDADLAIDVEEGGDVVTGVAVAGEVRHRLPLGLGAHPFDHVTGAMTIGPARAVRDRHEVGSERFERGDGATEREMSARRSSAGRTRTTTSCPPREGPRSEPSRDAIAEGHAAEGSASDEADAARGGSEADDEPAASVAEVAFAGEDHGDAVFVGGGDHLVVADRAARLDHRRDPGRGRRVEAVAEREERVAGARRRPSARPAERSAAMRAESSRFCWPAPMPNAWRSLT